jgi:hypothetical protein
MQKRSVANAFAILTLAGCAVMTSEQTAIYRTHEGPGPTAEELRNDPKNTDNVLTYGMGYHQNRYSTLRQINKQTVKRLVPAWNVSLNSGYGEQAQPLVYNGVMYVTDAEYTVAIDIESGKQLWRTPVEFDPATPRVVCCGVSNKGPAIYQGKLFRGTLDAFVVALEQKTGKQVWKEKAAEWKDGFSITGAPQIANGVLITGMSGAEFGTRLFLDGWDPDTGKHLWRRYTIPAPGEKASTPGRRETRVCAAAARPGLPALRPGTRPPLLGRATRAVESGHASGDNTPTGIGARIAAQDRRGGLALPVHAKRHVRLGRQLGNDPGRCQRRRAETQSPDAAQSQRLSVCARAARTASCCRPNRSKK